MKFTKAMRTLFKSRVIALSFLASVTALPAIARHHDAATAPSTQTTTTLTSTNTASTLTTTAVPGGTTTSPAYTFTSSNTTGGSSDNGGGGGGTTGGSAGAGAPAAGKAGGNSTGTGTSTTTSNGINDSNPGTAWTIRQNYFLRFPAAAEMGPSPVGNDVIKNKQSQGPATITMGGPNNPLYTWPISVPLAPASVPSMRDRAITQDLLPTTGRGNDTTEQLIHRYNNNRMLESAFDPERSMWTSSAVAGMQATSAANGAANMTVNQAQSAIDFTASYLTNFTAEANNQWQALRNQLFIPMAILLLLPGAVAAQVKAIVSQGSPVLGDVNPFEGILRSIVAIFLIPGTFLVINYGIDVANSITFTIADEYQRIFGTNMYQDANCAMQRAFPVNQNGSQDNAIMASENPAQAQSTGAPFSAYEALTLDLRQYDPCAGLDNTVVQDERVVDAKKIGRMATNFANVGLSGMWNVMCAFQMAFLYYLWCMGPIAAALWVWPISKLRSALPSWIEGVVVLCFWSLFWNTTVCLMACFRGVGDSGTVIMSALTFLANICVKYAFDFTGLISQGAATGVQQGMSQMMQGAASAAGGGGSSAASGSSGAGATGSTSGATSSNSKMSPTQLAGLNSALSTSSGQNYSSGVLGGGGSTSAASLAGGLPMPGGANPGGLPGGGGGGIGGGGGGLLTSAPPMSSLASLDATGGGSLFSTPGLGGGGGGGGSLTSSSANSSLSNLSSLSSLTSNGAGGLNVNQAALTNMFNNPGEQQKLQQAMTALQQNHDPSKLQSLAQQNIGQMLQSGNLSPSSAQALQEMQSKGLSLNASDTQSLGSFLQGGQGISFDNNGTAINSFTGQPISFGAGMSELSPGGGTGMYLGPNAANASSDSIPGTNVSYSDLASGSSNMFSAVDPSPTTGLSGLMAKEGMSGPMSFVDANGSVLPPGSFTDNGAPTGAAPNGAVMAMNSAGEPIASYSPTTGQWSAPDTNGAISLDSSTGQWQTANSQAPMTYDNGQWYAQGTNGSISYDSSSGGLVSSANGASMSYDQSSQQYFANGTNGEVYYNQGAQQFETAGSNAPVSYDSSSNQWYAAGTGGDIAYNSHSNSFEVAGSNTPVSYENGNYYASNNQVQYDSQTHQFEATGSGAPVTLDNASNQWYAAGSNNSLAYEGGGQFSTAGGAQVSYDQGQYYASNTNDSVAYDMASHNFYTQGGAPVSYDNGQYYAAGTGGAVQLEGSQWVGYNSQTGGTTGYSYDAGSQSWTPQSQDGTAYQVASGSYDQGNYAQYASYGQNSEPGYSQQSQQTGYDPGYSQQSQQTGYDPGYSQQSQQTGYDPGYSQQSPLAYDPGYGQAGGGQMVDPYGYSGGGGYGSSPNAEPYGSSTTPGGDPGYYQQASYQEPTGQGSYESPYGQAGGFMPAEERIADVMQGISDGGGYPADPGLYSQPEPGATHYGGGSEGYASESASAEHYYTGEHYHQHSESGHQSAPGVDESHSGSHASEAPPPPPPPQYRQSPAAPSRGFGAIIPPIGGARKPQAPNAKSAGPHPKPSPSDTPEPPKTKANPMDMGAKQGGYKTDGNKKNDHNQMLRDAWSQYQEEHPDEENPTEET